MPAMDFNASAQAHIYEPLQENHIRLLKLLPGLWLDEIEVELLQVPIDQPGVYHALSYRWGSTTKNLKTIKCDGHDFQVTANLFAALRRSRVSSEVCYLWVDAICINQQSVVECASQIALMLEIYSSADMVLVWLEEPDEACRSSTQYLLNLAYTARNYHQSIGMLDLPPGKAPLVLSTNNLTALAIITEVRNRFIELDPNFATEMAAGSVAFLENNRKAEPGLMWTMQRKLKLHGPFDREAEADSGSSGALLIGARDSSIMHIYSSASLHIKSTRYAALSPVLYTDRVRWAADQNFPDFVSFLKAAIWPMEPALDCERFWQLYRTVWRIIDQPYWKRAWIVQEIVVARQVLLCIADYAIDVSALADVFGLRDSLQMPWLDQFSLNSACNVSDSVRLQSRNHIFHEPGLKDWIESSSYVSDERCLTMTTIATILSLRDRRADDKASAIGLGWCLQEFGHQNVTHARDSIFSLIGLVRRLASSESELLWCQNLPYTQEEKVVFVAVATHVTETYEQRKDSRIFVEDHSPHILDAFWRRDSNRRPVEWPSWVPHWPLSRDITGTHQNPTYYEIDTLIDYKVSIEDHELLISGQLADEVKCITSSFTSSDIFHHEVDFCAVMLKKGFGQRYGDLETRFYAFWRTVTMDDPMQTARYTPWVSRTPDQVRLFSQLLAYFVNCSTVARTWGDRLSLRVPLGTALTTMKKILQHEPGDVALLVDSTVPIASSSNEAAEKLRRQGKIILSVTNDLSPRYSNKEVGDMLKEFIDLETSLDWGDITRLRILGEHRIISSKKGFFGIATCDVNVGDKIALIAGSRQPWYPREVSVGRHRVIGPAWVHGLMKQSDEYYQREFSEGLVEMIRLV